VSDPTPNPSPIPDEDASQQKLAQKKPSKRRGHADATDVTIEVLRANLAKSQDDRIEEVQRLLEQFRVERERVSAERERLNAELQRTSEAQQREREKLNQQITNEREKNEELARQNQQLAVSNATLTVENAAIAREQNRAKILEGIATFLTIIGGGVLSYTTDQQYKDFSIWMILIGGGVFALNFLIAVILGPFKREQ